MYAESLSCNFLPFLDLFERDYNFIQNNLNEMCDGSGKILNVYSLDEMHNSIIDNKGPLQNHHVVSVQIWLKGKCRKEDRGFVVL